MISADTKLSLVLFSMDESAEGPFLWNHQLTSNTSLPAAGLHLHPAPNSTPAPPFIFDHGIL